MKKLTKRIVSLLQSRIIAELGYSPDSEVADPIVQEAALHVLASLVASQIDVGVIADHIRMNSLPPPVNEPPLGKRAGRDDEGNWKRNWTP